MIRSESKAVARIRRAADTAINATFESLEGRQLMSGDSSYVAALPFSIEFDAPRGGLVDRNGNGTGFTWVQTNKSNNEYQPDNLNLDLSKGVLNIKTTGTAAAGGPFDSDNALTNSLQTQFNASTGTFTIRTRLVGPLNYIDLASEQGGITFGPDQDNYIKLVAVAQPGGTFLQFLDEQKVGASFTHQISASASLVNIGSFAAINTLDLEMVGNASTGKVQAFYRINGGALNKLAQEVTLTGASKDNFFNAKGRAGLIAMHKNDSGPTTVAFDRFEITAENPTANRPSVTASRPADGTINVSRDSFIAVDVSLPDAGHGVDAASLTNATVKLYRTSDRKLISATVNTTGGGDAIVLTPSVILDANTGYTFEINDGVKDTGGKSFVPFVMSFTTGTNTTPVDARIAFEKVQLGAATGQQYSGLTIGPDGKLYATTAKGMIHRFDIKSDGTLSTPTVIDVVRSNNGGDRFVTGLVFDPASTAGNLIAYVSHNHPTLDGAPEWSGKISRLSGANLGTYEDYVVGLPRSIRDHLTNQMNFGPDGKLYISQGSISAMGAPDNAWGLRSETLLAGAILKLDTAAVAARIAGGQGALDVQTAGKSNPYNPFDANAPLKLYATGVRNAYDLVWHSNGSLYAPTNGSAAGGATPGFSGGTYNGIRIDSAQNGPFTSNPIAGIDKVTQTENDYLHRVVEGGYYGHPNPTRGEFVQDGGNPTAGVDYEEFTQYPTGTQPDRNYRGAAYVFGKNYSPNGAIEYKSDAFGGVLKGKLLVVRYSGGDDIVAMDVQGDGSVTSLQSGITGLGSLIDPLDLVADNSTGNIYVSEYGAQRITLLRPIAAGSHVEVSKPELYFSDVRGGAASPAQKITIKNTGTAVLNLNSLLLAGSDASQFVIVTKPNTPTTIPVGGSVEVSVAFSASSSTTLGIKSAALAIATSDPNRPTINVSLRGLAIAAEGGANEPSLQRIFDLYNMPIKTGDINPASANLYSNSEPLSSINDEVLMPRLEKAGSGPVTFELISSWGMNSTPSARIGTYSPGSPATKSELFVVGKADAQTVSPTAVGQTSFDPGTNAFSLYSVWPGFGNREIYSEDALNTVESNASQRHKVRFYALRNPDGSIVPNAYVVAFEEFVNDPNNATDSQDIVAIIRNVKPSTIGAEIGLENMDGVPSQGRMIFSRVQNDPRGVKKPDGTIGDPPPDNVVHDRGVMRIRNSGNSTLNVSNIVFEGAFALLEGQPPNYSIAPGEFVDVTIVFNAQSGNVQEGLAKVMSNDADEPVATMKLAGMWQEYSEQFPNGDFGEHRLDEFFKLFGYSTKAFHPGQSLSNQGRREAVGDEVLSRYWQAADPTAAVQVTQLAAYHSQNQTEYFRTFLRSDKTSQTTLFTHDGLMGQSVLPTKVGETALAQATLPTAVANSVFGFKIQGIWSDDTLSNQRDPDTGEAHWVRMYPAKDASGAHIPNTWLICMDYYGINYDYQDNIYLITNVRPASPSTPTDVTATTAPGGIKVDWTASPEATATQYNVYRSDSATGTFVKVNNSPVTASEYLDNTAPASATSYYKISAADNYGGESAQSGVVSAARGADATAPNVPTGVTASSRLDGVIVNWLSNTEGDLAGYKVYRSTSMGGAYAALNGGASIANNALLDTTAAEGVTYYYKVSAIDHAGNESEMSAYATGTRVPPPDYAVPDAPTGIGATGQLNGIKVTWAANAEKDLAGYRIYRSTALNGDYTLLTSGQLILGEVFVDTSAGSRTYYYKLVAVDTSGNVSATSAAASATRIAPDPIRISAGGSAFTDAAGKVWDADRGFSGGNVSTAAYNVLGTEDDALYYTRRSGNFNYNLAMPDGAYQVRLLLADATYSVAGKRVFDVFAEGQQIFDNLDIAASVGRNTATSRTFNVSVSGGELNLRFANQIDNAVLSAIEILPIGDTVAPSIPRRPTSGGSQAGVRLDWNDNADSDLAGYNVYRSEDGESNFVKLNANALPTSEFTDATANPGQTWYYRITAVDIYGNESSGLSTQGSRPADTTPPAAPTGVTTVPTTLGVNLDWADNTDADLGGYNLYRRNEGNGQFEKLNTAVLTNSTYNDTAAVAGVANVYRITAVDTRGNESSALETTVVRPAAGTGLKAEYFDNKDLTNLKLTRTDAKIDFNWAAGSPDASIGVDTFSVRWTGQIQAGTTGAYTFTLSGDDGMRMYVNDVLVIDSFVNAGVNKDHVSSPVQLTAGQNANIRIEYFENTGGAYVQLYWQSATMTKSIVPTAALFPPAA